MIEIELDGQKVEDVRYRVAPEGLPRVLQTGRHAVRLMR